MPLFFALVKKVALRVGQTRSVPGTQFHNFVLSPTAMELPPKQNIMLHQISWFTYAVSILLLVCIYYLYVGLAFYRLEIQAVIYKLTGKQPSFENSGTGDIEFPDYAIMGKARPDDVDIVSQDELSFGPAEIPYDKDLQVVPTKINNRLAGDFSDMLAEVKTLTRVINESGESRENFGMLFRLIIQKYHSLASTIYQERINDFLLDEDTAQFPFPLTISDLNNYWSNEN